MTSGHNSIDPQIPKKPPEPIIPVVSSVLHIMSMTAAVFLRRKFGYSYLQPASGFVLIALALGLFSSVAILSQSENSLWHHTRTLTIFIFSAIILFFVHWLIAYFSVYLRKSEHEQSSGKSWLGNSYLIRILVEPVLVFSIGAALYLHGSETSLLGIWLLSASIAMSIKEAFGSFYFGRKTMANDDAKTEMSVLLSKNESSTKAPIRKKKGLLRPRPKQKTTKSSPSIFKLKKKYAKALALEPPYLPEQAEIAYQRKVTLLPENSPEIEKLTSARDFFINLNS